MPEGAELIPNPISGAPGIKIGNVYILAGVPRIAAACSSADRQARGRAAGVSVTVGARAPESDVADLLRETEEAHPGVAIGSYPVLQGRRYGANFVIRSEDGELARRPARSLRSGCARPATSRSTAVY